MASGIVMSLKAPSGGDACGDGLLRRRRGGRRGRLHLGYGLLRRLDGDRGLFLADVHVLLLSTVLRDINRNGCLSTPANP
jgi:hypothetical protein